MSDILRQIDEDIRKEKLSNLWNKYGLFAVSILVILVITVVGYQLKISTNKANNEKIVEAYISATNIDSFSKQQSMLEDFINSNTENDYLSGLAQLKIASLKIENGNTQEGLLDLNKVIDNNKNDTVIVDLAVYFLLMMKIDEFTEDEFMIYLTNERLQKSSFKYLFKELISIKKLLSGKRDESIKGFQDLIELSDTPSDLKIRARKFIEIAN